MLFLGALRRLGTLERPDFHSTHSVERVKN